MGLKNPREYAIIGTGTPVRILSKIFMIRSGECIMITVNLYYKGSNGNALAFGEETGPESLRNIKPASLLFRHITRITF